MVQALSTWLRQATSFLSTDVELTMSDTLKKNLSANKVITKKTRPVSSAHTPKRSSEDRAVTAPEDDDYHQDGEVNADENSAEYDVIHPTGDKMRDKVRKLLMDALYVKEEELVGTEQEAQTVANAIEGAMFKKYDGNGAPYKSKYRNISFNLKDKKNSKLRMAVLRRHIPPSELLELSNEELANDELKKTREEVHEKMTRDAMPYNKQEASTDMFKCGKCKQRKCTYFQMQTRSADEPLTTFVSCVNCGNRWKF